MTQDPYKKYEEHLMLANRVFEYDDFDLALKLYPALENYSKKKGFKRKDEKLFKAYLEITTTLKWVALPRLNEKEVLSLFENNLYEALILPGFNLKDKLRSFLVFIADVDERDETKKKIKDVITRNRALLTTTHLKKNKKRGTVEAWITDYVSNVGLGKVEKIKFENYLLKNENVQILNQNELAKLKSFLFFYESLKASSKTSEGYEGSIVFDKGNGEYEVLEDGVLRKLSSDSEQRKISSVVEEYLKEQGNDKKDEEKVIKENNKKENKETESHKIAVREIKQDNKQENPVNLTNKEKLKTEDEPKKEVEEDPKVIELIKELEDYAPGTLERKMIEQEIKKIKKSKK